MKIRMLQYETPATAQKGEEASPFIHEFFMIQGTGFRCMAYCDEHGKWRNAFGHDELLGEILILG